MSQIQRSTPTPSVLVIAGLSMLYLTSRCQKTPSTTKQQKTPSTTKQQILNYPFLPSNISQLMNYVGFATWFSIGAAVLVHIYVKHN